MRLPHPNSPQISLPRADAPDRWNRGPWLFRDRSLQALEILLDKAFRIPGTVFRFGIDGLIGLVPDLGGALVGLLSLVILLKGNKWQASSHSREWDLCLWGK
ncbi:MAG: DUF4112 domain-containing protein [Terracidiphilus sp.]